MPKSKFVSITEMFLVSSAVLIGCATSHQPANNAQVLNERLSQKINGDLSVTSSEIRMQVFPLFDDKIAKVHAGISPRKSGMLPVFIKVENMSQNPVKVDLPSSFVIIEKKQHLHMNVENAIERARKNYIGLSVVSTIVFAAVGGVTGAMGIIFNASAIASKNMTVDEHYRDINFKPTLINSGSFGSGIAFFDVPKDKMFSDHVIISVPIMNVGTNQITKFQISLQTRNLIILEEGNK
jgi:hypothetical protein